MYMFTTYTAIYICTEKYINTISDTPKSNAKTSAAMGKKHALQASSL